MVNYTWYENEYSNFTDFINNNPQIKLGDTIHYETNNQEGYKKYIVTYEEKGVKEIKEIKEIENYVSRYMKKYMNEYKKKI